LTGEISYADIGFYRNVHNGAFEGGDDELLRLLKRASRDADAATLGKAAHAETDFQKNCLAVACCYQADHISKGGGESVSGYRIGDLSVSLSKRGAAGFSGLCRHAYERLSHCGLMYRGVKG